MLVAPTLRSRSLQSFGFDIHNNTTTTANFDFDFSLDTDIDVADVSAQSIESSPHSAQSMLSSSANSASHFSLFGGDVPTAAIPRRTPGAFSYLSTFDDAAAAAASLCIDRSPEPMHSDHHWLPTTHGQLTPKSASRVPSHHHRESSLSSLGSAGPASPYTQTTSNPHIALPDSASDGFHDAGYQDPVAPALYHVPGKPANGDAFFPGSHGLPHLGGGNPLGEPTFPGGQRQGSDRGLRLLPDFPIGHARSNPMSVASSTSNDSPATPSLDEADDRRRIREHPAATLYLDEYSPPLLVGAAFAAAPPKFNRTMTDVYGDELYSPNFTIASASPPQSSHVAVAHGSDLFAQRLHAANTQHVNATHSPVSAAPRGRSPFQQGSPLARLQHDFSAKPQSHPGMRFAGPAHHHQQQQQQQQRADRGAHAMRRHVSSQPAEADGIKTISPKDAVLEFHAAEGDSNYPLFPQQESSHFDVNLGGAMGHAGEPYDSHPPVVSQAAAPPFQYVASHLPSGIHVPHQYPFVAHSRPQAPEAAAAMRQVLNSPSSTVSDPAHVPSPPKPAGASADGGTYTCTYHGCTLRFETPTLLQKHKREGHRQAHGLSGSRRPEGGMTAGLLTSQAGPHRCDRINPSTGKPCNTIFSRPYDLTRHEDTIHNARKQKVRCNMCAEEKTFSRADALTRHYRVCHPDVDFPGKHRRRGGGSG
jgi:hypothetical protein